MAWAWRRSRLWKAGIYRGRWRPPGSYGSWPSIAVHGIELRGVDAFGEFGVELQETVLFEIAFAGEAFVGIYNKAEERGSRRRRF